MVNSTTLLSLMAVAFLHILLILVAMLQHGRLARLVLLYLNALTFFSALYIRHRLWLRHQRVGLYRALGDTAVMLLAFMVAIFNFDVLGVPPPIAAAVRLAAAVVAACFLHRVVIRPLKEEAPQVVHIV
jgi:hypothetical protein